MKINIRSHGGLVELEAEEINPIFGHRLFVHNFSEHPLYKDEDKEVWGVTEFSTGWAITDHQETRESAISISMYKIPADKATFKKRIDEAIRKFGYANKER